MEVRRTGRLGDVVHLAAEAAEEDAADILAPLIAALRHALARVRAVPSGLGETYESVYSLIRRGGAMPHEGRWIQGASA